MGNPHSRKRIVCCSPSPTVGKLVASLLPGMEVRDFSLHFPFGGVATLRAEIALHEHEVEAFGKLAVECKLEAMGFGATDGETKPRPKREAGEPPTDQEPPPPPPPPPPKK